MKAIACPSTVKEANNQKKFPNGYSPARIVSLEFDEAANADCEDSRYGCTCIAYEKCCGCLLQ